MSVLVASCEERWSGAFFPSGDRHRAAPCALTLTVRWSSPQRHGDLEGCLDIDGDVEAMGGRVTIEPGNGAPFLGYALRGEARILEAQRRLSPAGWPPAFTCLEGKLRHGDLALGTVLLRFDLRGDLGRFLRSFALRRGHDGS